MAARPDISQSAGDTTDTNTICALEANEAKIRGSSNEFLSHLWGLVEAGSTFADVQLEFKDGHLMGAHSVVLGAISPFFHAMLSTEMREKTRGKVHLPTISRATFNRILAYSFGREVVVGLGKALRDLIEAADMMQLWPLAAACVSLLVSRLTSDTCLDILHLVHKFQLTKVKEEVEAFVASSLQRASQRTEWLALGEKEVAAVMTSARRNSLHPDILAGALLRWLAANSADPGVVSRMLALIRLDDLTHNFMCDTLIFHPCVMANADFIHAVKENMRSRLTQSVDNSDLSQEKLESRNTSTFSESHRGDTILGGAFLSLRQQETTSPKLQSLDVPSAAYLFVGSTSVGDDVRTVIKAWMLEEKIWITITEPPVKISAGCASVFHNNVLYITGGRGSRRKSVMYNVPRKIWSVGTDLCTGRYYHSMAGLADSVFAVAGCTGFVLRSVERYSLSGGTWQEVGALKVGVKDCGVGVLGESLVVVGGEGEGRQNCLIQLFNTRTGAASIARNRLPVIMTFVRSAGSQAGNFLCFVGGDGHLVWLTEGKDGIRVSVHVQLEDFGKTWTDYGVLLDDNHVLVCGGCRAGSCLSDVRTYSLGGRKVVHPSLRQLSQAMDVRCVAKTEIPFAG